jgi:hypothetical protein
MHIFTRNISENFCWSAGRAESNLRISTRSNSWKMAWYCSWSMSRPCSFHWNKRTAFSWHWNKSELL